MKKYDVALNVTSDGNSADEIALSQIQPQSVVLEFGCAYGRMTQYLKDKLGCKVHIVEIDPEGYNEAIQYAECGLCGDISDYSWFDAFKELSFDHVMFVDVLEHLVNPYEVLLKAVSLLKDDGSLIVSVPNVAHSAVILNLLKNKFEYTKLGLLDNTHLRFFTYNSLSELLDYCGMIPIIENGTTSKPEHTEIGVTYDEYADNTNVILNRDYAHVYQFVFKCIKKRTYYDNKDIYKIEKKIPNSLINTFCCLFFDTGDGFNTNEMITQPMKIEGSHFIVTTEVDLNVKGIRFDPVEGKRCILNKLEVITDNGSSIIGGTNGISAYDAILFDTADPQIIINFDGDTIRKVRISGDLYTFDFDDSVFFVELKKLFFEINDFEDIKKVLENTSKEVNELSLRIEQQQQNNEFVLEQERKKFETALEQEQKNYGIMLEKERQNCGTMLEKERQNYEAMLAEERKNNEAIHAEEHRKYISQLEYERRNSEAILNQVYYETNERVDIIEKKAASYQNMYEAILNSAFWKATKPFRAAIDVTKLVCKKIPGIKLVYKYLCYTKNCGMRVANSKIKKYFSNRRSMKADASYFFLTDKERNLQENVIFPHAIKISVITPVYNTPKGFLEEMIESVLAQTYQNWELCLADGSDESHSDIKIICNKYAKKEKRIKYKKLAKNEGISGNSNHCIDMATGDYIALLDHDDLLHPSALFEVVAVINEQDADFVYTDETTFRLNPSDAFRPHFKQDFSPDSLRAINYICHLTIFKRTLLEKVGRMRSECDGSQDHDIVLRLTEQAKRIVHIPKILYYWRAHQASVADSFETKDYTHLAGRKAIADHLARIGLSGEVIDSGVMNIHRIRYEIKGNPLVSILIPNKDHIDDLEKCLQSIIKLSTYKNYEIIIVENNSTSGETFSYYEQIERNNKIRVIQWDNEFNYSAINNFGVKHTNGEYLLLLNNDVEILTPDWMQEMIMFAQRTDVGAVGAKLYYHDDTIQHAGVIVGLGGVAGHSHKHYLRTDQGYMNRLSYAQNLSAVTGACLMLSKKIYLEVNGLNEQFKVAFNDVDLCMRIRRAGYLIVFTPFVELYHYESKTRGFEDTNEKRERFFGEMYLFQELWKEELEKGDPYYNPNLTLDREDFSLAST